MRCWKLLLSCGLLLIIAWSHAQAQTCPAGNPKTQAQLLTQFQSCASRNLPAGCITPQNVQDLVCSVASLAGSVATNTALKAVTGVAAGTVMHRAGWAIAGDGGAANYTYSVTPCATNSGNGDDGMQVKAAVSGCWNADLTPWGGAIYSGLYGVKCDGTTDDAAALQTFFSNNIGNDKALLIQAGTCIFKSPLEIATTGSYQRVSIIGSGYDTTILMYAGTGTTGDLIKVGSGSLGDGNQQNGWTISKFRVDTQTTMTSGAALHLWHIVYSTIDPEIASQYGNGGFYNGIWFDECDIIATPYVALAGASHDIVTVNGSRSSEPWWPSYSGEVRFGKGKISPTNEEVSADALPLNGVHIAGGVGGLAFEAVDIIGSQHNVTIDTANTSTGNQTIVFGAGTYIDVSNKDDIVLNDNGSVSWAGYTKQVVFNGWIASGGVYGAGAGGHCVNVEAWTGGTVIFKGYTIAGCNQDGIYIQTASARIEVSSSEWISGNGGYGIHSTVANPQISLNNPLFVPSASGSGNVLGNLDANVFSSILGGTLNAATGTDIRVSGALCDGFTDDITAIQALVNAVGGAGGGTIWIPAGKTCVIGSTLQIGDGSSSASSTYNNVILAAATIASGAPIGTIPNTPTIIKYTGSGTAISINGPLQGWGIHGITLNCTQNTTTTGVLITSAQSGGMHNSNVNDCEQDIVSTAVSSLPGTLVNADSFKNTYDNLVLIIPDVSGAKGMVLTGTTAANTDFNNIINVSMYCRGDVNAKTGMELQAADSNLLHGVYIHCGAYTNIKPFVFDYSINSGNWPASNTLLHIDPNSGAGTSEFSNVGSPGTLAKANWLDDLVLTNGAAYPLDLANLVVDHAVGAWTPTLRGSTTAGTVAYNFNVGSYTINGERVTADFHIATTSISGAGGVWEMLGLPITSGAGFSGVELPSCFIASFSGVTLDTNFYILAGYVPLSDTKMVFRESGSGQAAQSVPVADFANVTEVFGTCTYHR